MSHGDMAGLQLLGVEQPIKAVARPPRPSFVSLAVTVVGGFVGWAAWRKHRLLGLLNGSALAGNVHAVVTGERHWKDASRRIGCHVVATAGSLALQPHPAVGYVAGAIAADMLIDGNGTGLIEEWAHHSGIVDEHPVETVKAVPVADKTKALALPATASS